MMENKWTKHPTEDGFYIVKYHPYNIKSNKPQLCCHFLKNGRWYENIDDNHSMTSYGYEWLKVDIGEDWRNE